MSPPTTKDIEEPIKNGLFPGLPECADRDPNVVTKAQLAALIGCHRSRVSQLIAAGLPVLPGGKIDRSAALGWIKAHVKVRHGKPLAGEALAPGTRDTIDSLKIARARLALDREAGRLVDRAKTEAAIFARARFERDAHLAWVQRTAPVIAAELGIDPAALHGALDRELRSHLADLARTPLPELGDAKRR